MGKSFLKQLIIRGLHYYRNFDFEFQNFVTVLVGENGVGKTTVMNILYALIRGRWKFLSNVGFDYIEIHFTNGKTIAFSHAELEAFLMMKFLNEKEMYVNKITIEQLNINDKTLKAAVVKFHDFNLIIRESISDPVLYLPSFRSIRDSLQFIGRTLEPPKNENQDESDTNEFQNIEEEILIPIEMNYLNHPIARGVDQGQIEKFTIVCNEYLQNIKLFVKSRRITPINKMSGEIITFDQLSSGEKQIIYIFSHVYLIHKRNVIILFDEPELSLSLTWQRRILPDIVNSGRCSFLLAITHSPFVFDNELEKYAQGINISFKDYGVN